MRKSNYSLTFVLIAMVAILGNMGFNYFIDPFTYYHQPWVAINISNNHRYANPGLARQFNYTTALVGTSHVMELESRRLSEIASEPAINLSISGGVIREQAELVELILRQGKADTILWEMNYPSFSAGEAFSDSKQEFPKYFYHADIETPFLYLMSYDTLRLSLMAVVNGGSITLDNRNQVPAKEFSQHMVYANWELLEQRWNDALKATWADRQQSVVAVETVLEKRIFPIFRAYPEVQFKLFLPPSSVLFFLRYKDMGAGDFDKWMAFRNFLARRVDDIANVTLFDFQADPEKLENLDLYRDLEHYNQAVLEEMFVKMNASNHQVNATTIMENTRLLSATVNHYGVAFCQAKPERCSASLKSRLGLASSASSQ
jgi:hypothetical protein